MTVQQISKTIALSGAVVLGLAGAAFADDATISNTGPGSTNLVTINNQSQMTQVNTNNIEVMNSSMQEGSSQSGSSGSADVSNNTSAGGAMSGSVTNSNTVSTSIGVNNQAIGAGGGTGSGGGAGSEGGIGSGGGSAAGSGSGSGSSVGSGGSLPEVGCSQICDVSGLRAAFDAAGTTVKAATNPTSPQGLLSLLALILSMVGGLGAAALTARRQLIA